MQTRPLAVLPPPPPNLLRRASLFLDFDGTLVEIAERPEAVTVDDHLRALMQRLEKTLDGRLAIITGRPAEQVRLLFGDPTMTIAGSHGLELLHADGRALAPLRPEALGVVLSAMKAFAADRPRVLVEDKPLGVALHFRQAPQAEDACIALAVMLAERHSLVLQRGKMMVEVRAGGGDKGAALRHLMQEGAMAGTTPIFLGDDATDEPGFLAAGEQGGAGILIGAERPTAARYRLAGVGAVLAFLEAAVEDLG